MTITIDASQIDKLAPMPASVVQLAVLMHDQDVSIAEVARVIEFDEALTANILKIANSVWSRARAEIRTVKEAVMRLGTAQILKISVGRQIAGPMNQTCPGYELAEHELWQHSVASALAAEHMESITSTAVPKFAFTAALMHDIGKLLLGRELGHESLLEIRKLEETEGLTYLEAERKVMGVDHAEVGGEIAKYWNFPEPLVLAIQHHHDPDVKDDPILDVVHLANAAAKLVGTGLGTEEMNMHVSMEAPRRLGLSEMDYETLCANVRVDLGEAEKMFMG
jgi:putative nucleotidyltransferase with HDIG domain